ncbi:hypothetical protein [Deinococcus sp. UYEF24]
MSKSNDKFTIAIPTPFTVRFNAVQLDRLKKVAEREELSLASTIRLAVKRLEEAGNR